MFQNTSQITPSKIHTTIPCDEHGGQEDAATVDVFVLCPLQLMSSLSSRTVLLLVRRTAMTRAERGSSIHTVVVEPMALT